MSQKESDPGEAQKGLRAYRDRLAAEIPQFKQAIDAEEEAESFCRSMRESLRGLRRTAGVDQTRLADLLGLTQSAVSRIERGSGDIGLKTLFRYARALGHKPFMTFTPSAAAAREESEESSLQSTTMAAAVAFDEEFDKFFQSFARESARLKEALTEIQESDAGPIEHKALSFAAAGSGD